MKYYEEIKASYRGGAPRSESKETLNKSSAAERRIFCSHTAV